MAQSRERMRTTPRVIFIPNRASLRARRHKTLTQKKSTTWWQESTRKSHTVSPVHLQESRRQTALPVNRNFKVKRPCDDRSRPIFLALQQFANNNISANVPNNINRVSKMPKSLTTSPMFDRKPQKFRLFDDLFQMSLKIHIQLTEDDRINYFHSLMKGDALQTIEKLNGSTR